MDAAAWRRTICAASIALFTLVTSCRRPPAPAPSSPPAIEKVEQSDVPRTPRLARTNAAVVWIGLDGLDWEILDRLAGEGRMPNWARLAREGYSARLQSFLPLISPILWTTAATGVSPDVHRVLDFQEVDPATGRKVPVSGRSRAVPAVWNLASEAGRTVGAVGWWGTHPAEEVRGFFVSDRVSPILFDSGSVAGSAYPEALQSGIARVLARDGRVDDGEVARWLGATAADVAAARASGEGMRSPPVALERILAATRITQRVVRDLYDRERPDLTAFYLEGTDEIAHVFGSYAPPKLPCVSETDAARYGRVVDDYYALIDSILGQWMRRAAEDGATLIVHSDHGFKWGSDRPCGVSSGNWSTAAFWHRPVGVFAVWGARVRPSPTRGAVSLFDVAPTVLALLGIPADVRMSGAPIASAFAAIPSLRARIGSQLLVRRVPDRPVSAAEADAYTKKLLALGYLSPSETPSLEAPGGDRPGITEGGWNNLGVFERDTRRDPAAARKAFETALRLRPDYYSPMYNLAVLEREEGHARLADDWLLRALSAVGGDPAPVLVSWAHEEDRRGRRDHARSLLERGARTYPENEPIARELALALFREHDCSAALSRLSPFASSSREPRTFNALALFQTCLKNRAEVVRLLERSLELKPDQPEVARSLEVARGARDR